MIRNVPRKWTAIKEFPEYIISELSEVKRVMAAKGARVGRDVKPTIVKKMVMINGEEYFYDYYQIVLSKDGKLYTRSLRKLATLAFSKHIGHVREFKIKKESNFVIKREKTRLITENISEDFGDLSVENYQLNFPKRGRRHPKHKLTNGVIELIRNNLDMGLDDFIARYGKFGVTRQTLQAVMRGESWRVRTEPFSTMTYPEENYEDNLNGR